ncbi:RNA-metabolizing metallo-beta-lactamase [Paraburkholderia caballeronis]|nr:RNA-metabolizing metallo-beta-lactamase [Paraburkholderia caballeronis]
MSEHARVETIASLSARADYHEVLGWLGTLREPPARRFVTHGEPAAADSLRRRIEETLHGSCEAPQWRD